MDFFESAHLPLKHSRNKEKKPNRPAKKHIKQMLNAYKSGNNDVLKNIAESSVRYDTDDMVSISDYSYTNNILEGNTSLETISSNATVGTTSSNEQSNTIESLSEIDHEDNVKSNDSVSDIGNEDTMESLSEYNEDLKSLTTSEDITDTAKSIEANSSFIIENISGNESVSSSLGSSNVSELISDDEPFDPDGVLASKIIEKLKSKQQVQLQINQPSTSSKPQQKVNKKQNKFSKDTKNERNHKRKCESLSNNESISDIEDEKENWSVLRDIQEMSENSLDDNSILNDDNSLDDLITNSSPFVSITATDIISQSLSDLIGAHRHSTVKNLPSEKQTTIYDSSKVFEPEIMYVDDLGDDVDSLIPELDDDIAIDDLNLESDTQEPIEESTAYDDTILTDTITDNESSQDVRIKVYPGKHCFILVMKHPAELNIHGKVKVACLGGTTELFGYTLQDEPADVYAPYCYYAHCIKTIEYQNIFRGLFSKLTSAGLSVSNAEEIVTSIGEYDAVLCLSKLINKRIDFVDNNCESTDLFTKRVDTSVSYLKHAAEILGCSLYDRHQKRRFDKKEIWEEVVDCGKVEHSRGIVCGGKGTGKSTFLRYYVNRILDTANKSVLVIDLDPGQAEFTLPGCISVNVVSKPLIGPNFTHLRDPEKTLNLGMINTMDNPIRYISAVNELINYCKHNYRTMPWIVNTMGMCNQIGLKFISYIILQIQPTFVYQIDSKISKKRFEFDLHSLTVRRLYNDFTKDRLFRDIKATEFEYNFLMERCKETSEDFAGGTMTPRKERYLNILAYFGKLLEINSTRGLLEIVPYEVSISNFNIALNVKIPEQALTKVINGKIIALCQLTPAPGDNCKLFTLKDKALLCHGHGLIRGINTENGLLYILTPTPKEKLSLVNTLLYADWMPELLNEEQTLPSGSVLPYRASTSTSTAHHRQLMDTPRRRFNPLQLLKMSRNT